ncbi:DUF5007 domain-containing protein [Pedobacter sp. B4-66]|uniref:DUF5007 domain-containing protein n=1 Tax=Pedobacter sp. B4-66 TaxID=2817280 RepID=UPI001BDA55D4|nr:DUF5007 domain-containing protein [Pedobacter sp. B4-66]
MYNILKYKVVLILTLIIAFSGCRKIFDLPDEKNYLSTKAAYVINEIPVTLGRTNLAMGIFNADNSSFPMTFEIINPRFGDGRPADDMLAKRPVLVWTAEYTGNEKSVAEIDAKRKIEERPMLEVRASGDIILWESATSTVFEPRDSVSYPQDIRYFDVKVKNSGGTRIMKNLFVNPFRERPYEPSNDINRYSGKPNTTTPNGTTLEHNHPVIYGMKGEGTNADLEANGGGQRGVVYTYIRKVPGGTGNSLRFKFLDKDSVAINPAKFNETKWDQLVHGFNKEQTNEYVKYEVAYPIPVARIPTRFTSGGVNNVGGGGSAHVEFVYSRKGFGGFREQGVIAQDFTIFEKGDWEIVFHFKTVNPKFEDE